MKILPARSLTTGEVVEALLLALSVGSPLRRVSGTFPSLPAAGKMSTQAQNGKTRAKRPRPRAHLRWHHHWRRPSRPRARRLSRQGWTRHSRCRAAARLRRRSKHQGGDRTRLLSQPAFHQSFPHQRGAVVQGPRSRRTCHLHHAALRIRPSAQRWHRPRARPRPRGDRRQYRALLKEGRRHVSRVESQGRANHRQHLLARALFGAAAADRARGLAVTHHARPRVPGVTKRQPLDVVQELFENEHVRLLFLFKIPLFGTWLVDTLATGPMGSVIRAFDLETGYQLCQGGSFNLARGLMETFIAAGGHYQPQVAIDRIIIEGGQATGIALADGRTVRAKFIASTLDVHQTFEQLVGRGQLPEPFRRKLDGFQSTPWALYGLHLALHESPRFAAASFDPNIDRALKWSIGAETM